MHVAKLVLMRTLLTIGIGGSVKNCHFVSESKGTLLYKICSTGGGTSVGDVFENAFFYQKRGLNV